CRHARSGHRPHRPRPHGWLARRHRPRVDDRRRPRRRRPPPRLTTVTALCNTLHFHRTVQHPPLSPHFATPLTLTALSASAHFHRTSCRPALTAPSNTGQPRRSVERPTVGAETQRILRTRAAALHPARCADRRSIAATSAVKRDRGKKCGEYVRCCKVR